MSHLAWHERPTIGVLAGWQYYWRATPLSYLAPLLRAIRLAARDLGCNLLLGCGMGPSAVSADPFRPAWPEPAPDADFVPIGPWNTDGIIAINPLHSPARSRYLQGLLSSGHPIMFIASGEAGPTIVADNEGGVFAAIQHLVRHGHREIAFIAGNPDDMAGDTGARLRAYQRALDVHGLAFDGRLLAFGHHTYDGGYAAMRQIMAARARFTALMASNDESAMGAMEALRQAGMRIPQDVAVIGFDDRPENVVQEPALSSVHVPVFELGYRAVELLLKQILGQGPLTAPVIVPTRLMARASCGCGAGGWPTVTSSELSEDASAEPVTVQRQTAAAMAAAVLVEAHELTPGAVSALCQRLVSGLIAGVQQGDRLPFSLALDAALQHVAASGDDPHLWQVAVSLLRDWLPGLLAASEQALAREWLDAARIAISTAMWRQHRLRIVNERQTRDRVSLLTTRLLAALDETQAYQILAQSLSEMDIRTAAIVLLEAEDDDPVAWSMLRSLAPYQSEDTVRFRSRAFPPARLPGADEPFSLALVPLVGRYGQRGYVSFDTDSLELYGAIVQQLAAALNTAQLYREATEGRRLAEAANRLKSRFLSMVSHELRTPLSLIVELSNILLQEHDQIAPPLPEPFREDVERILANAQHLGWLINDVLDLASDEVGQLRLTCERLDLSEVLRPVVETGRQLAANKGLAWHDSLPPSGPWVWGDRIRLRQVALNLVHNAVKFTTQGEVRLEIIAGPGEVMVEVYDTGLGIPPAEQEMIFSEFGRTERSIARGYGGLGLGLAICKRLVELHGGAIGVRSTGQEGEGSTFYFSLPTIQVPVQVKEQATRMPSSAGVLVLTQHKSDVEQLCEHLRHRGIQVSALDTTAEWLAQVVFMQPSVIVLNVGLTSEHGWQMVQALRRNPATQEIPLLFHSQTEAGVALLEMDYLAKPVSQSDLTKALDQRLPLNDAADIGRTILVVDDDPDTVELHARIVQAHSSVHRVMKAYSGRAALDILRHQRIDLVLLDLLMPEVDGFAVLQSMREAANMRDVPVIVLTGQVLTEVEMARLTRGVVTVLEKGLFSLEETVAHISAALERRRKVSDEARRLVRQAMAFMHEHYAEPISRQDLARHVGMDGDYLTVCFRKELGVTPIAYLNRYRVHQAKRLLTETDQSITEIARAVGFSDSGYFSRIFRRETGYSPEAYRRA